MSLDREGFKVCGNCRWWFPLSQVHDKTEWRNCLALPFPACAETMTRKDAQCIVPDLFQFQVYSPKGEKTNETV